MTHDAAELVIASNRLPCTFERQGGAWKIRPGSGGLVTAMSPVLRDRGGVWIGWHGAITDDQQGLERLLASEGKRDGYELMPVSLTDEDKRAFYHGFANEIIWPLFHCLDERCNFDPHYWESYQRVNRKFAGVIRKVLEKRSSHVWVHDYHLMMVGGELRQLGIDNPISFFLHTPFPPIDIFQKLPWRFAVLRGLLEYDLIGFQTPRDRTNFVRCVRTLLPDCQVGGRGQVQTVTTPTGKVRIGAFPISIDYADFERGAKSPAVSRGVQRLRQEYGQRKVLFGVDRLDYTKGVPYRLKAFRCLLRRFPDLRRNVTLVQVVVPSRREIPAYQSLREEIDELVGEINGEYTEMGWVPIHYIFRSLKRDELLAYYRAADAALVTPLIDGMNLVAKEYCACNVDRQGVLILSEFAGAAAELQKGALLVNPYDVEAVAESIRQALTMSKEERRERMNRLRQTIRRRDVFHWVETFLQASTPQSRDDLPPTDDYVPSEHGDQSFALEAEPMQELDRQVSPQVLIQDAADGASASGAEADSTLPTGVGSP